MFRSTFKTTNIKMLWGCSIGTNSRVFSGRQPLLSSLNRMLKSESMDKEHRERCGEQLSDGAELPSGRFSERPLSVAINKYQGRVPAFSSSRTHLSSFLPGPSDSHLLKKPRSAHVARSFCSGLKGKSGTVSMAEKCPEYTIRLMKREEIPAALDIWKEIGLAEGTHTLETWFDHDPEAFYVAVTDDGTVLGVCAGVLQHEDLAFIGMYAVRTAYQRRGIGRRIWDTVMARVGDRNAGVNPVPDQLSNYRDRAGFPVQTSWCSMVCESTAIRTSELKSEIPGVEIRPLSKDDHDTMNDVVAYDSDILGYSRANLISKMVVETGSITMVAVSVPSETVRGYGSIKENITGNALIGPLYADDIDVAEVLYYHLIKASRLAETKGLTLMTIDLNPRAVEVIDKLGLEKYGGIARLYRKHEVDFKSEKVFAHFNLNFSVV